MSAPTPLTPAVAALLQSTEERILHHKPIDRPFVNLSFAQSLDGSLGSSSGAPLALSSAPSFLFTHHLRAIHDAILVGIGTVKSDNPRLTVRLVESKNNPHPIVIDSKLEISPESFLVANHPIKPIILTTNTEIGESNRNSAKFARKIILETAGAEIFSFPPLIRPDGREVVDLSTALKSLNQRFRSIMVEGGASIISSFFESTFLNKSTNFTNFPRPLFDQLILTISPHLIGGIRYNINSSSIMNNSSNSKPPTISNFPRLYHINYIPSGEDFILRGDSIENFINENISLKELNLNLKRRNSNDSVSDSDSGLDSPSISEPGSAPLMDSENQENSNNNSIQDPLTRLTSNDRIGNNFNTEESEKISNIPANSTRRHVGRAMRIIDAVEKEIKLYEFNPNQQNVNNSNGKKYESNNIEIKSIDSALKQRREKKLNE